MKISVIKPRVRYKPELEERMRGFYQTLSEKDRRRYAALEARRLGWGGEDQVCGGGVGLFVANH